MKLLRDPNACKIGDVVLHRHMADGPPVGRAMKVAAREPQPVETDRRGPQVCHVEAVKILVFERCGWTFDGVRVLTAWKRVS